MEQFKNLVAGDLYIVFVTGQKLRISAVAEVSQTREKGVQEKSVLHSKLPSVLQTGRWGHQRVGEHERTAGEGFTQP